MVWKSHINVAKDTDSLRQDINLDSDSNSASSSTDSVVSIVSRESSTDYLLIEFESEDSFFYKSSFVNDSEFSSRVILQINAQVDFALALNLSRTPRL